MPIAAIIFDMGDIFYDATPWRRAIVAALAERGVAIDFRAFVCRWEEKLVPVYLGRRPYWEAFDELLRDFNLALGRGEEVRAIAREKAQQVERRVLFPGVGETLAELKRRGLKLAVLSDTESREPRVRERLAALAIEEHFDAVLTSVDIGFVKPQPEAYAAALTRLGATAGETAFVGHDDDELRGAMDCGVTAIGYNCPAEAACHRRIEHFSELLDY